MEDMKKTVDLTPRPEYPRPDFVREDWMNLNGTWAFAFDDENVGLSEGWQMPGEPLDGQIVVPFAYQTKLSGIGPTDAIHPVIWYKRTFVLPENMREKRILLRFGAVDYACSVYVNGHKAGDHVGGYIPFAFEISGLLEEGENEICLRVEDEPDVTQPRGKQYWQKGLMGCWYTPVSGIWQTVYLEAVGETWMKSIHITPDIDRREARVEISLNRTPVAACEAKLEVSYEGQPVQTLCVSLRERITTIPVNMNVRVSPELDGMLTWSPSNPCLYDLKVTLTEGAVKEDCVSTYFGMRKVEVKEGRVYLNNCPIYQRLILDQGYWPDSLITPPSDEAIRKDIQLTLDFGYNGARKHQKVEDPRYYYWADKMGLLVWGEVPSAYLFCDEEIRNVADTLQGFIDRDFNHPSIICWVPLNESWGVREIYTDAQSFNLKGLATKAGQYRISLAAIGANTSKVKEFSELKFNVSEEQAAQNAAELGDIPLNAWYKEDRETTVTNENGESIKVPVEIWHYRLNNGIIAQGQWVSYVSTDANGIQTTAWYYLYPNTDMATSAWIETNGKFYYVDENGVMLVNTTTPDNKIVNEKGERVDDK